MNKLAWTGWVYLVIAVQATAFAGLQGTYYESDVPGDFTTPGKTQWDLSIDYDWGTSGPGALGNRADLFAIRWEGMVHIVTPGAYTFYSVTDDGARLSIDGNTIIDRWVDQGATEHAGSVNLTAGDHALIFEYFENTGGAVCRLLWSGPGIAKQVMPPSAFVQPSDGFSVEFYNSLEPLTSVPVCVANVPQIAFDWNANAPAAGVTSDNFSARFRGWLIAPETGTYTFTVASDDGADLYIGNTPLITRFGMPQSLQEDAGTLDLTQGEQYLIDLRYAELGGNAACYLYWQTPSMGERSEIGQDDVAPAMRLAPAPGRNGQTRRLVAVGGNVVLAVQVEQAEATPSYAWHFRPANDPGNELVLTSGTATSDVITVLLQDLALDATGAYWCVANDGRGPIASAVFDIEVVTELPAANLLGLTAVIAAIVAMAAFVLPGARTLRRKAMRA